MTVGVVNLNFWDDSATKISCSLKAKNGSRLRSFEHENEMKQRRGVYDDEEEKCRREENLKKWQTNTTKERTKQYGFPFNDPVKKNQLLSP